MQQLEIKLSSLIIPSDFIIVLDAVHPVVSNFRAFFFRHDLITAGSVFISSTKSLQNCLQSVFFKLRVISFDSWKLKFLQVEFRSPRSIWADA